MSGADAELLAAFVPEFAALAERLGAAADLQAAARALDAMRAMAAGLGVASLTAAVEAAAALLDPPDLPGLRAAAPGLAAVATALADGPAPEPPAPAATTVRTLIVDDSAVMRRVLRAALAPDPAFEVVGEAAEGEAALAAMRALRPALTLLDLEMPGLDGFGVLRALALEGGGAVVVVSSAARPGSDAALEVRRLGAAAVVAKPSGALSLDLAERGGAALRRAARRAAGVPA